MPFQIIRNDITKVKTDAIVNTANPQPTYGGGTDSAIYKAAGEKELLAERKRIGVIRRGDIAVTPAFNLRAKYIIHTVALAWEGGDNSSMTSHMGTLSRKWAWKAWLRRYQELKSKKKASGSYQISVPFFSENIAFLQVIWYSNIGSDCMRT